MFYSKIDASKKLVDYIYYNNPEPTPHKIDKQHFISDCRFKEFAKSCDFTIVYDQAIEYLHDFGQLITNFFSDQKDKTAFENQIENIIDQINYNNEHNPYANLSFFKDTRYKLNEINNFLRYIISEQKPTNKIIDIEKLKKIIFNDLKEDFSSCLAGVEIKIIIFYANLEYLLNGNTSDIRNIRIQLLNHELSCIRNNLATTGKLKQNDTTMHLHHVNHLKRILKAREGEFAWVNAPDVDYNTLTDCFIAENSDQIINEAKIAISPTKILGCMANKELESL